MKICVDQIHMDIPIIIDAQQLSDAYIGDIMDQIFEVLRSKNQIVVDDTFKIDVEILCDMSGGSDKMSSLWDSPTQKLYSKRCVIRIKNTDV